MAKTFKINPKNYNPPFKKHARMIRDKITKALKPYGYVEHIEDDYLGIEGFFQYYKHPQRVCKIFFSLNSDFSDLRDPETGEVGPYGAEALEIHEIMGYLETGNSINTQTDMHEEMIDSEWEGIGDSFYHQRSQGDNTFDANPRITVKSTIEKVLKNARLYDEHVAAKYSMEMSKTGLESVFGKFGDKNSDFASVEDVVVWLEWLGYDPVKYATEEGIDELLPQTVKDVFLF